MKEKYDLVEPRAHDFIKFSSTAVESLTLYYWTDYMTSDENGACPVVTLNGETYHKRTLHYSAIKAIRLDTVTRTTPQIHFYLPDRQISINGLYLGRLIEPLRRQLVSSIQQIPTYENDHMLSPTAKYPDGYCCIWCVEHPTHNELERLAHFDENHTTLC